MIKTSPYSIRQWAYFCLVLSCIALMAASFTMPWWRVVVTTVNLESSVEIYGYGLRHNLSGLAEYVQSDETPLYQTVLAWIYLGVSILVIAGGLMLKGWRGKFATAAAGAGYLAYALVAVYVIVANRTVELGVPFLGQGHQIYEGSVKEISVYFESGIETGFYLALAAGAICIVLALLRSIITGKPK